MLTSPNNSVNPASDNESKVDAADMKRDGNPTSQSDQELTKEIITMLVKGEEPAAIEEMIIETIDGKKGNEESAKERQEEPIKEVEYNDETERSKGGGEECRIMTCHQFTHVSDGGSVSNLKASSRHQITSTLISPLASSRMKPKTYLPLKSNKVDPIRDAYVSDENPVSEITALRTFIGPAVQKNECVESPKSIEHRTKDICSYCKRLQNSTPISANNCNIFKDKKGRYFCEFCAPTDRIISRVEVKDPKKLRCANCRLSLRPRGFKTNIKLKPDACPKCGQSQTAASSPSSM